MNWAHHVGVFASPLEDPFVKLVLQGCERISGKPTRKKEPLTCPMIKELIDLYRTRTGNPDLRQYRFLLLTVVCFSGFLRIDEILHTQLKHVQISSEYLSIFLPKCKNDQLRHGNTVYIARTNSACCPVTLTEQFLRHAQLSLLDPDAFLIPRLIKVQNGHIAHKSAGISYTTAREAFAHYIQPLAAGGLHYIQPLAAGGLQFPPHSLRAGGASAAAANGIKERLISKHGRWKSERARNGYIEDSIQNLDTRSRTIMLICRTPTSACAIRSDIKAQTIGSVLLDSL